MRNLLLLVGAPYSGKSTYIKNNCLEEFTISLDGIRLLLNGTTEDCEGNNILEVNNSAGKVISMYNQILENRLNSGVFTVLDNMNISPKEISNIKSIADKYDYKVYYIDFRGVPLETLLGRSRLTGIVKKEVIEDKYNKGKDLKIPFIKLESIYDLDDYYGPKKYDWDPKYEKVYFIGDIHGCKDPLMEFLDDHYSMDNYYVFTGDYIDRGPNSKEVLRILSNYYKNGNIMLLEGNHEKWIRMYSKNRESEIGSKEFMEFTLNDFTNSLDGIYTKRESRSFVSKLRLYFYTEFNGVSLFASHGGVSEVASNRLGYKSLSAKYYINGAGSYGEVDLLHKYKNQEPDHIIHGHRNKSGGFIDGKYINLEGGIDAGGELRYASVSKGDTLGEVTISTGSYESNYNYMEVPKRVVESLINSPLIKSKELSDDTVSISIDREIFTGKKWDKLNVKARGLFVYKDTNEVAARSYDKFFNLNENEDFTVEDLKNLSYPVYGYDKSNGYLGIVSLHKRSREFIINSKSTNVGKYAEYFQDILFKYVDKDELRTYLERNDNSLVFEVIAPSWDPHVIAYKEEELVLLDSIKNNFKLEKLDYYGLSDLGRTLFISDKARVKRVEFIADNPGELIGFMNANKSYEIEGFVFEDSNNFMFKYKNSWFMVKRMLREYYKALGKSNRDNSSKGLINRLIVRGYIKGVGNHPYPHLVEFISMEGINKLISYTNLYYERMELPVYLSELDELIRKLIKKDEDSCN